jgi:deoxyribose-phosphate aldolase
MKIAEFIDHTLLRPEATPAEIEKLCREGMEYGFASVCVNPAWVPLASTLLRNSGIKVCTVAGFPLGASTTSAKVFETREAISNGAEEIDTVMNLGALKSGDITWVKTEIEELTKLGVVLKVIIETGLLSEMEKVAACEAVRETGADFVKTCTGFGPGRATVEDVRLMRKVVGGDMGVKASGGIRDFRTAEALLQAGASRIGTSTGVQIVKEAGVGSRDESTC